ncbi:MAG: hypothetical protein CMJ17_01530 [Phenylobacterium sp.]|nr:hypothetical protein [Phenylobacterium sp.]
MARAEVPPESAPTKNIQVIDDAINASYSIFAATEAEFSAIFPRKGQDIEFSEDFFRRAKPDAATEIMNRIWERRVDKKTVGGIHGTLFYGLPEKKKFYERKREPVIDGRYVP